jgi:hypothetical protein
MAGNSLAVLTTSGNSLRSPATQSKPASEDGPQVAACETASQDPEGAFTCKAVETAGEGEGVEAGEEPGETSEPQGRPRRFRGR